MQETYRDKILVARPVLDTNPVFHHSVVYLYEHRTEGEVIGVILNKPSQFRVSSLGALKNVPFEEHLAENFVHKGGPVSDTSIMLLHTSEWTSTNTLNSAKHFSMTSDLLMIQKLAMGNEPKGWRMFAGMSVWNEHQLDKEIEQGAWLVMESEGNEHLIFDYNNEDQYLKAIEHASSQTWSKYI